MLFLIPRRSRPKCHSNFRCQHDEISTFVICSTRWHLDPVRRVTFLQHEKKCEHTGKQQGEDKKYNHINPCFQKFEAFQLVHAFRHENNKKGKIPAIFFEQNTNLFCVLPQNSITMLPDFETHLHCDIEFNITLERYMDLGKSKQKPHVRFSILVRHDRTVSKKWGSASISEMWMRLTGGWPSISPRDLSINPRGRLPNSGGPNSWLLGEAGWLLIEPNLHTYCLMKEEGSEAGAEAGGRSLLLGLTPPDLGAHLNRALIPMPFAARLSALSSSSSASTSSTCKGWSRNNTTRKWVRHSVVRKNLNKRITRCSSKKIFWLYSTWDLELYD